MTGLLVFVIVALLIGAIRLLYADSAFPYMQAYMQEYDISPEKFAENMSLELFLGDIFNLLDWTPHARGRFLVDQVHKRIQAESATP